MSNNKCRVCLADEALHLIFENAERADSVQTKFFQCFKEKIEDIEGYPRNICGSCNDFLNTTINYITKYHASSKLLSTLLSNLDTVVTVNVKKEDISDNSDDELTPERVDMEICKNYPETDWEEPLDDSPAINPFLDVIIEPETNKTRLTDAKEKLKNLKEIHFKSKPVQKTAKDTNSLLEAVINCTEERVKSSATKEPKKRKPRPPRKKKKPVVPNPEDPLFKENNLCDICGKIFKDKHSLKSHRKTTHFNTPRECPQCHKILNSDYYLKKHMSRIHGNKSLVCDTCGKKYAFIGELNTHVKETHLKLRPKSTKKFGCDKCDRCFVTRKSLLVHDRSAHTGERPAVCSVCGSRFYHDDYLKLHMRLHTGETPFECPVCKRGYAQEGNMRSHMKYNHRLSDLSPEEIKNLKPGYLKCLKKT